MESLYKKRVLIAATSKDLLRSLNICLRTNGCYTILARDAVKAMSLAMTELPDVILMDSGLPQGDTYRLVKRLQSVPATNSIPIIIVQAESSSIQLISIQTPTAQAYIQMPLHTQELLETVQSVLYSHVSPHYLDTSIQDIAA